MKRKGEKSIATVILNYNGEEWIEPCLQSLSDQTDKSFDIYFVDQGSTDNSVAIAKRVVKDVKIIQVGKNLGYTAGCNYGYEFIDKNYKQYDYYLMLGNDAICEVNLVAELRKLLVKYRNQKIGVIGPVVVSKEMVIDMCGGKLSLITGRCNGFLNGQKYERENKVYRVFWCVTCCALVNAKLLKKVGYNDDYYGYFDDISMCWKFNNLGYKCVATMSTYCIHLGSMTFKKVSEFKMFLIERNRIFTFWQNLSTLMFMVLIPWVLMLRIIALGLLVVMGKISLKLFWNGIKGMVIGMFRINNYPKLNRSVMVDLKNLFIADRVNLESKL